MTMRVRNELTVLHVDAAGIDIGGGSHFVAVLADSAEPAMREFGCYTQDLQEMAARPRMCAPYAPYPPARRAVARPGALCATDAKGADLDERTIGPYGHRHYRDDRHVHYPWHHRG